MKNEILKILKKGEKSTTKIASSINRNHYATLKLLEDLEKEGKITRMQAGKFTFWKLQNDRHNN